MYPFEEIAAYMLRTSRIRIERSSVRLRPPCHWTLQGRIRSPLVAVAKFIMVGTYTWVLPAGHELPEELVSAEDQDFSEIKLQEEEDHEVSPEDQDDLVIS